MYSANVQQVHVPAIIERSDRTSTPVSCDAIAERRRNWIQQPTASNYFASQNVFDGLDFALGRSLGTPSNWNSYDSPPPSSVAVANARPILQALRAKLLQPERVVPSAEGGVAFTFVSDTVSRAIIEALNDGETFVLLYDVNGNSKTIEWPAASQDQMTLLSELATHLRSDGLATKG